MMREAFGLITGLGSGALWGVNNFLFAIGYSVLITAVPMPDFALFPLVGAAVNDVFAAVALLFWYGMRGRLSGFFPQWKQRQGRAILAAALLGGPVGQACYALGVIWAGPSYALVITASYPILGCLMANIFLHQPMKRPMWLGTLFVACGAVLVGYLPAQAEVSFWGILASVVAACCWAMEIVLATWGMQEIEPAAAITLREVISGSVLTVLAATVLVLNSIPMLPVLSGVAVSQVLWLAGAVAVFSYLLDYQANHLLGCARGMATNATYIIWGVALNVLFADASIRSFEWLGCLLVFVGVLLVAYGFEGGEK